MPSVTEEALETVAAPATGPTATKPARKPFGNRRGRTPGSSKDVARRKAELAQLTNDLYRDIPLRGQRTRSEFARLIGQNLLGANARKKGNRQVTVEIRAQYAALRAKFCGQPIVQETVTEALARLDRGEDLF